MTPSPTSSPSWPPGSESSSPSPWASQMNSSTTALRPHVGQRVAKVSPIDTRRLDWPRGAAPRAWNAASRWRTSGGRRTISARSRVSGLDSIDTARRWRSTAARATQPPRPCRSTTTSPGDECPSMADATRSGGGGAPRRSNAGSVMAGSGRVTESRATMVRALCHPTSRGGPDGREFAASKHLRARRRAWRRPGPGSARAGHPRIDPPGPTARRARRAPLRTPRPW